MNLARAWPICLVNAAIAYFTITGLLFLLAPDIAELIINRVPTARLVLATVIVFVFLSILLVLTYAASLFIVKRESIIDGFKGNGVKLVKGFLFLSTSIIACLAIMFAAIHQAILTPTGDVFKLLAMSSGAGLAASFLFALPLVWLMASLAREKLRMGFRLLAVVALVFLMLTILSIYGLLGLFIDSMLIPTVVSLVNRSKKEEAGGNGAKGNRLHRLKHGGLKKKIAATTLSILILSTSVSFNTMLVLGEESRFSEDRLRSLVSKAIAEGWSAGELANAIKGDPGLSILSNYDLNSISIERDDAGSVEVTIPLNAMGYAIYRKASNKTTVYDVYAQTGSSELVIGDRRYVLAGYRSREETLGPFENLGEALAKESEVKKHANATRITSNTLFKTETREATRVETKYAIVPKVRVAKYEVLKEFENQWDAENYLYCQLGMFGPAEIKEVEKKTWVYSYRLAFDRETKDRREAMMIARDENNYVVEEVRERIMVYVFDKHAPLFLGPIYLGHHYAGEVRIRKNVFEKMLETGMVKTGRDLWGLGNLFYYYASEGDAGTRLYKKGEAEEEGDVTAWRIHSRIDTSHWETRKAYQVVIPRGYEEKKVSIDELPSYAKGFASRRDAEASKSIVEQGLKNWAKDRGMTYISCGIESYEERIASTETFAREVKQYYVTATFLKPVYDVYQLQPYHRVWNETYYEETWGWVFKGYVDKPPETYKVSTWVYTPEVANWTSKTFLGIVTEWEAQVLMSTDPRYVAEKHNTTTITREVSYYDVYNATWRLLYRHYKHVVHPVHEYITNGNISTGGAWAFENLGEASGETSFSTYRSSPSSLRIVSRNGRGAWRQTFHYAGGSNPVLCFWYILRGSGAVAVKKPDGSASVFTLAESSGWSRFHRDSGDVFNQAGYYTISFVASENSELIVDDVSLHVGGYGEWVYQGDIEKKPENVPSSEKYEAFYKIENKRLIGIFEENVANQYPTPPYIKEFRKRERVSYDVDLYKLYYLEGGVVRYRVFHWEKYEVPIVVRKEETGASWVLVETGVETDIGQRILIESNVPENVVRTKYSDPTKYYLVPKVVDSGEALELVCETLDGNLARKYEKEGYVVKSARVSAANPMRFSMRVLQASVEKNELGMLGKQNLLHVAIANPTGDTLTYQVVLEAEGGEKVEYPSTQAPASSPAFEAERIVSILVAEPGSWLLAVPREGASYQLVFTVWVRRTYEGMHGGYSENVASASEALACSLLVKVLRNGRLVARQRILESFESFNLGRVIARHPFDFAQGFLAAIGLGILTMLAPEVGLALTIIGLATSTVVGTIGTIATGDPMFFLTYGPTGIIVLPMRALADPTLDDETRCKVIGALVGALGVAVAREISNQLYISYAPEECKPLLRSIEGMYGTATAARVARGLIQLDYYCSNPGSMSMLREALTISLEKGSIREFSLLMDRVSELSPGFLSRHADEIALSIALPDPSNKLSILLSLSPGEVDALAAEYRDNLDAMVSGALLKKLGAEGSIVLHRLEANRLEIMVEKSVAEKLFKDIREGQYAWFRLVGEKGEVSVGLPFKEIVLNAKDWRNYLLFSLTDDHVGEATGILLGDVKVALDFTPPLGDMGFPYYGSSGWGYGAIGPGGVRTSIGTYFTRGLSQELVWSSDVGYSGVELNKLALSVDIGGQRVLFLEGMTPLAAYGGSYLPAVIIEDKAGLRLGEHATPSGGSLVLSESSLAKAGIQTGLVNIIYPNKEAYTTIYTGGSLQIPLLSYSSGAFVGVQEVETRIIWTSIGQREFYGQIASISQLLESILRRRLEEFIKILLQSDLTDTQALDIANELVRNIEWLKTFSDEKSIELVKKITEYVKKEYTAEEARERVKQESEQYVKNIEKEIVAFLQDIGDPELAKEIASLFACIKGNLPDWVDAAKWLLDILKRVRGEKGNAGLKIVVEKIFKYSEGGCAQASSIVSELRKKSIEQAWEELSRLINYPEGLKIKSILKKEGDRFRIYVSKTLLESYLGSEACWVRIDVKGRTLYKEYASSIYHFNLPEDIGEDSEEVEVTIVKITTYEFMEDVLRRTGVPFDIAFSSGKYQLIVEGKEVCELLLSKDVHYDNGNHGPAVILAIRDYEGEEHLIKLVHKESKRYVSKIKVRDHFREIESMSYKDEWKKLEIEYFSGEDEETASYRIYFEDPKAVLLRKFIELKKILEEGHEDPNLEGDIGQEYIRLYLRNKIKMEVSRLLDFPENELEMTGPFRSGPDFHIYRKGKLVMIIELETTRTGDIAKRMSRGKNQLNKYFTQDGWKDYFKKVKYGLPMVIALDLDKIIASKFAEGIEPIFGDLVINLNYEEG
ncbi:MAG: hypothetical protein QW506_00480 [Thermoproteota archaeon]